MKKRVFKFSIYFLIGFLAFFAFRMYYGYQKYPDGTVIENYNYKNSYREFIFNSRNFASNKWEKKSSFKGKSQNYQAVAVDQKFEKIATIGSQSSNFDKDCKILKQTIKAQKGLIQYERSSGLKGNRDIQLAIGVNPARFDTTVQLIKKIGKISQIQIDKVDKTNEYKDLNAKKVTLDKTRNSLIELKKNKGTIEERINLENRILDIEDQIQKLGVNLGDFDEENEFCTIKFSLNEIPAPSIITLSHRIMTAFQWTLKWYALFIFILGMISITSYYIILSIQKGREFVKKQQS